MNKGMNEMKEMNRQLDQSRAEKERSERKIFNMFQGGIEKGIERQRNTEIGREMEVQLPRMTLIIEL
jgi:hypothetical protein